MVSDQIKAQILSGAVEAALYTSTSIINIMSIITCAFPEIPRLTGCLPSHFHMLKKSGIELMRGFLGRILTFFYFINSLFFLLHFSASRCPFSFEGEKRRRKGSMNKYFDYNTTSSLSVFVQALYEMCCERSDNKSYYILMGEMRLLQNINTSNLT